MLVNQALSLEDEMDELVPPKKRRWTSDDDARLARMFANGVRPVEMARVVGRTLVSVNARLSSLGLTHGRGQRRGSVEAQFMAFVMPEPNSGCWLWMGSMDTRGYGQMRLTGRVMKYASHVALGIVGRPVPKGMCACHRCDNPACVNPDHLFVGTKRDNTRDMMAKGRHSPPPALLGSRNPRASVSEATVREIRAARMTGQSYAEIGRRLGVTKAIVANIVKGKTWRHVA